MQQGGMNLQMMAPFTPVVKKLLIANVFIWLVIQLIIEGQFLGPGSPFTLFFSLVPARVVEDFYIWQPFTYMFLHSNSVFHIALNMLALWWFGGELEQRWGSKFFALYYFVCGFGAGIIYIIGVIIALLINDSAPMVWVEPVIGASGAVFGILLAFGIVFGERVIYLFMTIPMKAKYFVMVIGVIEFASMLNSGLGGSRVANLAHLGGLVTGLAFLIFWTRHKNKGLRKKSRRSGRNLKLVVNNDNKVKIEDDDDDGPRYWN